jgi:hypothetical protein
VRDLENTIKSATGETEKLAKVMRDTTSGAIKELNSAVESLGLSFFKANDEGIRDFVESLTIGVRQLDKFTTESPEIAKMALAFTAVGTAALIVGVALAGIGAAITFIIGNSVALAAALAVIGLAFIEWVDPVNLYNKAVFSVFETLRAIKDVIEGGTGISGEQQILSPPITSGGLARRETITTSNVALNIGGDTSRVTVEGDRGVPGFSLTLLDSGALA